MAGLTKSSPEGVRAQKPQFVRCLGLPVGASKLTVWKTPQMMRARECAQHFLQIASEMEGVCLTFPSTHHSGHWDGFWQHRAQIAVRVSSPLLSFRPFVPSLAATWRFVPLWKRFVNLRWENSHSQKQGIFAAPREVSKGKRHGSVPPCGPR